MRRAREWRNENRACSGCGKDFQIKRSWQKHCALDAGSEFMFRGRPWKRRFTTERSATYPDSSPLAARSRVRVIPVRVDLA
jgi:hypothetical protein